MDWRQTKISLRYNKIRQIMENPINEDIKQAEDTSYDEVNPVTWIFTIILVSTAMLLIYIDRTYYRFL